MLYCINKSAMHQRLDTINKRRETVTSTLDGVRLKMDHNATKAPVIAKPTIKPAGETPPA